MNKYTQNKIVSNHIFHFQTYFYKFRALIIIIIIQLYDNLSTVIDHNSINLCD